MFCFFCALEEFCGSCLDWPLEIFYFYLSDSFYNEFTIHFMHFINNFNLPCDFIIDVILGVWPSTDLSMLTVICQCYNYN